MKRLVGILSPLAPGSGSRRAQNVCNGSFMVGTMPVEFSEVLDATNDTAQQVALNNICSEPELLRDFELTMFPAKQGSIFSSGVSFLKDLFSQKTLPVEDMSSFSGDSDYPSNTAKLDRSFEEFSAMVRYELALARIQAGILLERRKEGYQGLTGPSRLLLRRLFYRQKVERDVLELRKRFGDMEKLFQRLEGSTAMGFEELRQCLKQLSVENKKIIDDGLVAIEKASKKDRAALDAAFDELKAKLSSFEKQFAPFVKDLEKASKSGKGSLLERLKVEDILRNAAYVSGILYHIVSFIRDCKPDPTPTPPAPAPPSPSPVQEEEVVSLVEPPPSKPTTHYFYKSIGRQNKGLLHKEFALTPSVSSKFKVPVGPDDRSNVSVLVCTGDNKVACKVSCAGLFEDKARMTFTAGLDGFKPKAKLFYAFPFAGVNGHLNASVVCGAAPDLKLALTLEKLGIVAGGKVLFDPFTKRMKHHEFGMSYGPGAVKLVDGDTLKLSLYEGGLSHGVSGGLELTYSHAKEEAVVCGAVKVKVSDGTAVKAKVDSTGAVTAAVQHRLSDGLDVGACVRVSRGEAACYGFSVKSRE